MDLSSMLGGSGFDPGKLAGAVQDVVGSQGGVEGLLGKLRAGGLGDAVDSWVSTGSNQPVEPQKLGEALGPDTVQELASKSGLSIAALLPLLAGILPMIIDHLTPGGQLPKKGDGGESGGLGGIGDLIGSVLGGGGLGGILGGGGQGESGGGLGGGLGDLLGGGNREAGSAGGESGSAEGGFGGFGGSGDKDRVRP